MAREEKWSRHVHVERGGLHGWCEHCPEEKRHEALERSVREDGYATTVRRLNFLRNIANRSDNRRLHEIAGEDLRWLERRHRR